MSTTVPAQSAFETARALRLQAEATAHLPRCVDCGSNASWLAPTGEHARNGAQLLRCADSCPSSDAPEVQTVAAAPTYRHLGEQVADRIAAEMPEVAAKMRRDVFVTLVADGLRQAERPACPDGRTWCAGDPASHADPREHIHRSPEQSMNGAYGFDVMAVHLLQFNDDEVELAFVGMGDWPDLDLDQVDELVDDMAVHLDRLRALRAQMAALQDARGYAEAERYRRAADHRDDANVRDLVVEEAGR
ncbi:hypothetical protein [Streptomyces sp. NPDC048560]|uniref:DUF6907 domain-containing protein n=1 Tax=Streptomyces sp. NPDC048560 TaxID=3155488 RepID=UPI00344545C9